MSKINFNCTILMGTNKAGSLKADAAGYYEICLGGFDCPNSGGAVYPFSSARKLFEDQSSALMRRVSAGNQRGEYGHPKRQPGQSLADYIRRSCRIEETMVSHHIRDLEIDDSRIKGSDGRTIISVIGQVRPTGPYGDTLAAQLENEKENVAFSIRCTTDDRPIIGGGLEKHIRNIITWDYVNEPGISTATKFHSPSLESVVDQYVDEDTLIAVASEIRAMPISLESSDMASILEETISAMRQGRLSNRHIESLKTGRRPGYLNW